MSECFACMYVLLHVCLVPSEARRVCQIPWSWGYSSEMRIKSQSSYLLSNFYNPCSCWVFIISRHLTPMVLIHKAANSQGGLGISPPVVCGGTNIEDYLNYYLNININTVTI